MPASRTVQQPHDFTGWIACVGASPRGPGFQKCQALGDAGKHITGQLLAVDGGASAVAG